MSTVNEKMHAGVRECWDAVQAVLVPLGWTIGTHEQATMFWTENAYRNGNGRQFKVRVVRIGERILIRASILHRFKVGGLPNSAGVDSELNGIGELLGWLRRSGPGTGTEK
jgi:hypothetical protein